MSFSSKRSGDSRDYLSLFFWIVLGFFALQALAVSQLWPFAWIGLGAATIILKQRMNIQLPLIIEAPIFFLIIGYSATTIYLAKEESVFDLEFDPFIGETA